jgi:hypothetical protein
MQEHLLVHPVGNRIAVQVMLEQGERHDQRQQPPAAALCEAQELLLVLARQVVPQKPHQVLEDVDVLGPRRFPHSPSRVAPSVEHRTRPSVRSNLTCLRQRAGGPSVHIAGAAVALHCGPARSIRMCGQNLAGNLQKRDTRGSCNVLISLSNCRSARLPGSERSAGATMWGFSR